jgi:hypothetical protein
VENNVMCAMDSNSSFSFTTAYTFPPISHLGHPTGTSATWSSYSSDPPRDNPPSAPSLSGPGVHQYQQNQTYDFGFEDAPFMNIPADSLPDDHNDPYVPSEGDIESDDTEQASQISNSEVCTVCFFF